MSRLTCRYGWSMALAAAIVGVIAGASLDPMCFWMMPYVLGLAWGQAQTGPELPLAGRPAGSRLVRLINRFGLPLYLWHPTALVAAALATARLGPIPGLNDPPTGPAWLVARLAWLPVLTTVLVGLVALAGPTRRSGEMET